MKKFLKRKSVIAAAVVIVAAGGYFTYRHYKNQDPPTRYVLGTVTKGTLITSISGSGQISASNQIDIKPKVSGDLISVPVSAGQQVTSGQTIAQIDATNALKSVRDAQLSLDSAQLALSKLQQPADSLSLLQAQNALTQAQTSKQNAQNNLTKGYDDGYNSVANAFLDLPNVISGLDSLLHGNDISRYQDNVDAYRDMAQRYVSNAQIYRDSAENSYQTAKTSYDQNLQDYKNTSRYANQSSIELLTNESYDTTKALTEAVKNAKNLLDFVNTTLTDNKAKIPAIIATHETSIQSYTGTTNSHLSDLLNVQNSIQSNKNSIMSADQSIAEKTNSLAKLQAGTDPLDLQSQQLSIQQKVNALNDAKSQLADYTVRVPFDGILAAVNVKKGDSASSATAIATLISQQQIADISLNEVDAAKIQAGQKATLAFDAITDLEITGHVASIDSIGTVSSGVVTYNVKLALDTQDARIKPGMSVSAAIITEARPDVLMVPNSAVKSNGVQSYVETLDQSSSNVKGASTASQSITSATPPANQTVTTGLANDSMTEITSGLNEGDQVVTRTISGTTAATSAASSSSTRSQTTIPGIGGGGGTFRAGGF
ncbi:HlyD family efflux transporter periplasmic adaptor subunit [bacterium]|nr:MAG: HlyD family efflux transporter periplasmic adaptor subunit [bacterium]